MDRSLLARNDGATLGEVARHLEGALSGVGYGERSYYTVPGGFALATRLEQITPDGTPKPDPQRWSTALPEQPVFSLGDYLRALFAALPADLPVSIEIPSDTRAPAMGYTEWTRRAVDATRRVLQELDA